MPLESPILVAGFVVIVCATIAIWVAEKISPSRTGGGTDVRERVRRSGGNALLALQEFVDPRTQHVQQVHEQRKEEDDQSGGGEGEGSEASLRAELLASLGRTPTDPGEVRRHLRAAREAGLDWKMLYDESVRAILADQPYRAPSFPPAQKVAPSFDDRGD